MDILFTNATILPMTAAGDEPRTFTGAVGVAGNRIALVTASGSEADAFRTCSPGVRVIDCTGRLLMPGLVNTHCHAAMTLQRSYADDIALMEWLNDYIWPFEARQTADDVALGMTLGIVEMLLGGVTSFVDMYYHENRCVEVARRLGIRAMLGCNYFDNNVDEVLPEAEKAVALAADCDRIQIALAPHSPYTVSPENLRRGKELARKWGLHFMTHIAETRDEVRIVREKYAATPVEHLDALGLGASSYLEGCRFHNTSDFQSYVSAHFDDEAEFCQALRQDMEQLSVKSKMEEFMFLGLRLTRGVSVEGFITRFGQSIRNVYGGVIDKLEREGLLEHKNGYYHLTERGLDLSNYAMSLFLLD